MRIAVALAFIVVVLGAYVRLSHAGLGCPDWPGCYGKMIVPEAAGAATELYPDRPLEHGKAWKEMIHRYAAGALAMMIGVIAFMSWGNRQQRDQPVLLPVLLAFLVLAQAALGMWTVTLLLKPVVVLAHLVGGMTILALLFWLALGQAPTREYTGSDRPLFPWALAALVMLIMQIMIGGWTSANYAGLACPDFPVCQGVWWPAMNFSEGFTFWHKIGVNYEGGVLAGDARTAIQMAHRIGALCSLLVIGAAAIRVIFDGNRTQVRLGLLLLGVLITQIVLGISNVLLRLPLAIAVAHNAVAALLLLGTVALLHQSSQPKLPSSHKTI